MPREQSHQRPLANPLAASPVPQPQHGSPRSTGSRGTSGGRGGRDDDDMAIGNRIKQQQQIDDRHTPRQQTANNNNRMRGHDDDDHYYNNNNQQQQDASMMSHSARDELHGDNITYHLPSGAVYTGSFEYGKMHGKGRYDFTNGDSYEGDFINDKINGYGSYYYATGDSYIGYWEAGRRSGKGRYTFGNDGGSLVGSWKRDYVDGPAQLFIPELDKPRYDGTWMNSLRHGRGIQRHPNGSYYDGDWERGREEGLGVFQAADGTIYSGEWRAGQRDGNGILIEHGKKYVVVFTLDYCMSRQPLDTKRVPKSHKDVYDHFTEWWDQTRGVRIEEGREEPPRDGKDVSAQVVPRHLYEQLLDENKALQDQLDNHVQDYVAMETSMTQVEDDRLLATNDPVALKKSIKILLDQRDTQRKRATIAEQRVARSRAAGYDADGRAVTPDAISQADKFMGASMYKRPSVAVRDEQQQQEQSNNNSNNNETNTNTNIVTISAEQQQKNDELQAELERIQQQLKQKETKLKESEKRSLAAQNAIEELQQEVNASKMREVQARQEASQSVRGGSHRASIAPAPRGANDADEITRLNFELTRAKQTLDENSSHIADLEKKLKHEKEKHKRASREREDAKNRLFIREMEAALNERLFRLVGAGQMIILGVLTTGGALSVSEDQKTLTCASPEAEFELDCIYKSDQLQEMEDEYVNAITGVRNGYSCAMLFLGSDEKSRNSLISSTLPNIVNILFNATQQMSALYEVSVSMSFVEVHRQSIADLFNNEPANVTIMKDARGTIAFDGALQVPIRSADEAVQKWSSTLDNLQNRVSNKFLVFWVDAVDRASKATFHGKLLLADICASSSTKAQLVETETNNLLSTALTEFASTDAYQHRNEPFLMAMNDAIGGPTRSIVLYAAGAERAMSGSTQSMLQTLADCREKISNFPLQHFETPHALALQKYVAEKAPREMPPKFFPLQQGAA